LLLVGFSLTLSGSSARSDVHAPGAGSSHLAWKLAQSDPIELIRLASQNEISNSYGRRPPLRYRLRKVTEKADTTKEIVETSEGGVARLIATGGRPLSLLKEQEEFRRLRALEADPAMQAHRRREEMRDAERVKNFMRLLPDAFLYRYIRTAENTNSGPIRLSFAPNPRFSPPDFASRILTGIHGEIWIDPGEMRIVRMDGRTFKTVDFGWGIIGSLYPGATMLIEQSKTSACGWQLARLRLHMEGKELIFKSLRIVVEETASDYQWVPREWKYRDAVRWLLHMHASTVAELNGE
jgi:hypothetical protein